MPSVAALRVDSGMARFAESNQILPSVCTAFGQRLDVVNLLRLDIAAFLQTQFAQRMGGGIAVADAFPSSTVPAPYSRVSVYFS